MERLKRCSKKVTFAFVLAFVVSVTGVFSTSFSANAQDVFTVNYARPTTSDTQGYVSLKIRNKTSGVESVNTFFWSVVGSMSDLVLDKDGNLDDQNFSSVPIQMRLTINSDVIRFDPIYDGATFSYCHIAQYNTSGALRSRFSNDVGYLPYTYDYSSEGYEILNFFYGGNVGAVNLSYALQYQSGSFEIVFNQNDHAVQLQTVIDKLVLLASNDNTIISKLTQIVNNTDTLESKLGDLLEYQYLILQEMRTSNTWLGKIWNSIQDFFAPDSSDKGKTDGLKNDSDNQSNEINDLNEQGKTEKVDIDSASGNVDMYIDGNAISNYGTLLSVFTNHEYILQCILVVLAIGLVAYVLFGKKR